MLPAYTTPEAYLEDYMPQDFSLGDSIVTDMSFIDYEDNQGLANAFASYAGSLASGKSMRCSFAVNGIPAKGSFTIRPNVLYIKVSSRANSSIGGTDGTSR
jgi:hypothetical protein